MGLLQTGAADMAAAPVIMSEQRARVVGFAPVVYPTYFSLVAASKETTASAFGYLSGFRSEVWAFLLISLFLASLSLAAVELRRASNSDSVLREAYDNIWDLLRCLASEGHQASTRSSAGRLLLSSWWLATVVLANALAGQLKASLAIRPEPARFRSVADVVHARPQVRPVIWRGTVYENYVRTSDSASLRQLALHAHRHSGFVSIAEMSNRSTLEQLYSGRAVIVNDRDSTMHMLSKHCGRAPAGNSLYVAPELLFTRFCSVAYSRRVPKAVVRRIHAGVRALVESGLHGKWYADALRGWHRCQAAQEPSAFSVASLQLQDLAAVFYLWTIIVAAALLALLTECLAALTWSYLRGLPIVKQAILTKQSGRLPQEALVMMLGERVGTAVGTPKTAKHLQKDPHRHSAVWL
ncbi:glutamate receptor 1-like [Amblyomma americanum]